MALGLLSFSAISLVAVAAVLYQFLVCDFLLVSFGAGKELQPLSDFPYQCRRLTGPGLGACEDMWLFSERRTLYLACSNSLSRKEWMSNIHCFNVSGRPSDDKIIAMKIDKPECTGFEYSQLTMPDDHTGVDNDKRLHVVGITSVAREAHDELFVVNARPSIDLATGQFLDQETEGGNSTIEQLAIGAKEKVKL